MTKAGVNFVRGLYAEARLGRDMKDLIIIDNSPLSYQFQPENAVPSISWYDDKNDTQLLDYIPLLKELSRVDDVRPFIYGSVKDNVLDIPKCSFLIESHLEGGVLLGQFPKSFG